MLNCNSENKSAVIDRREEIFHVHATRSIAIHERLARASARARGLHRRRIISEDAVSETVCILLLSRKPVVVSSSRLFAPGRSGVTPARVVSCVRNRTFRYARRSWYFIKTHLWYFRIPSGPPLSRLFATGCQFLRLHFELCGGAYR